MPGLNAGALDNQTATTPGRATSVTFDLPQTVVIEPFVGLNRVSGREIRFSTASFGSSYGVRRMQSGYIGLEPLNGEMYFQHERIAGEDWVMRRDEFTVHPDLSTRPMWRRPDELPGVTVGSAPDTKQSGDAFFTLPRPHGQTWAGIGLGALPMPPMPKVTRNDWQPTLQMHRVAHAIADDAADMGYMLRWIVHGNPFHRPDATLRFYFGGPLCADGLGHFVVTFLGSGDAILHEMDGSWVERERWRYCNPKDVVNNPHFLQIIPHGRYFIEFRSQVQDYSNPSYASVGGKEFARRPILSTTHTHQVTLGNAARRDSGNGRYVTGVGKPAFDIRGDQRPLWQAARLVYNVDSGGPSGRVIDAPISVPFGLASAALGIDQPITLTGIYEYGGPNPADGTVAVKVYDAEMGTQLPVSGNGWLLPGGQNLLVPVLELDTPDSHHSPYIWSYHVERPAVRKMQTPGAFSGGILQEVEIHGGERDPSGEGARLRIVDPFDHLPRLRLRGEFLFEIRCAYDEPDGAGETVLFKGVADHVEAWPIGIDDSSYLQPDRAFEYRISASGIWKRLARTRVMGQRDYSNDLATIPREPWKVTDVVRAELSDAGFDPATEMDIPDNAMRLWPSPGLGTDNWRRLPGSDIGSYLRELVANYLGGWLFYDPNAGVRGMWRLKVGGVFPATPLMNFLQVPPPAAPGVARVATHPGSWGYPNGMWIQQDTLRFWVVAPEGNAVVVCMPGENVTAKGGPLSTRNHMVNPKSVDQPRWGTFADPDSADYIDGNFYPIVSTEMYGVGPSAPFACAWATRRIFDIACRAQFMCGFTAPLVLVSDASDTLLGGKKRMLRYGDTVTLDGIQWFVRTCNPEWNNEYGGDAHQSAVYELQGFPQGVNT